MKFLIVAAVIACAYAAPSAVVPVASPGDFQAAAIDASVKASDVAQHVFDQTNEAHGEAIAAHEERSWEAVDAVKTAEAEIDGAAAAVAPTYANGVAPIAAVAPIARVAPIAPVAYPTVAYPYNAAFPATYPAAYPYNAAFPYNYNYGLNAGLVRAW